jgi:hypothetical protein
MTLHQVIKEEKKNQRRAIRCEFEHVGPTMFKNPLDAGWGLLPTLRWVVLRSSDELVDTHLHIIHNFDLPQVV